MFRGLQQEKYYTKIGLSTIGRTSQCSQLKKYNEESEVVQMHQHQSPYGKSLSKKVRGTMTLGFSTEKFWKMENETFCCCGKWATTKLLDCSFVVRLIGYGLARKNSRIQTGSSRMCPTSSMGGGVLALLLSSPGAQSSEGSLQAGQAVSNPWESNPFLRGGGLSLLQSKVGPPIYIYLALCLGTVGV